MCILAACRPSDSQSVDKSAPVTTQNAKFKDVEKIISVFFDKYKTDGPKNAIDYISGTNQFIENTQMAALKNKLDSTNNLLGTFRGAEQIVEKDVSSSLVLFSYLVKYKGPYKIYFYIL